MWQLQLETLGVHNERMETNKAYMGGNYILHVIVKSRKGTGLIVLSCPYCTISLLYNFIIE